LGEITLADGGGVRGRVILEAGRSPVGIEVRVDEWNHKQQITQLDGTFSFEGLAAGKHTLVLKPTREGARDEEREFELAAGETKELTIDLSGRAPCKVRLQLMQRLAPQSGLTVVAQRIENGARQESRTLGTSGPEGFVEGECEGGSEYSFEVSSPNGIFLARGAPVLLQPGGNHAATIAIEAGEVVILLPESLAIPESGQLSVLLRAAEGEAQTPIWFELSTEKSPMRAGSLVWKSRRVELGAVAAGRYRARVNAQAWKVLEGGQITGESLLGLLPEVEIVIKPGETTVQQVEKSP